ncbi:hypothetical protein WDV85_12200 [Pseudokineococcus sp. 5B2Z-1]|uniref:hypothetical protein n=1 Tax=Pseudokineococcus sp. 5B2Z-1 TaxID=3132744 RepID=UPI0030981A22
MRRRRGMTVLVTVGLSCALLGLVPVPAARASCAGPLFAVGATVDDARAPDSGVLPAPGADVTVSGVWFRTGCDDTGQGAGCSAPASTEAPMRDVDLVLEQGDRSWTLGTQDASSREDRYAISWTGHVPPGARPGPATLRAGSSALPVHISG